MYSGRRRAPDANSGTLDGIAIEGLPPASSCLKRVSWFSINCKIRSRITAISASFAAGVGQTEASFPDKSLEVASERSQSIAGSAWPSSISSHSAFDASNETDPCSASINVWFSCTLRSIPICIRTSSKADCTMTYHCSASESPSAIRQWRKSRKDRFDTRSMRAVVSVDKATSFSASSMYWYEATCSMIERMFRSTCRDEAFHDTVPASTSTSTAPSK